MLELAPMPNESGTSKQRAERPETEARNTQREPNAQKVELATETSKDDCMIGDG